MTRRWTRAVCLATAGVVLFSSVAYGLAPASGFKDGQALLEGAARKRLISVSEENLAARLTELLKSADAETRSQTLIDLAILFADDPETATEARALLIAPFLRDPDSSVRTSAGSALVMLFEARGEAATEPVAALLMTFLDSAELGVRFHTVRALGVFFKATRDPATATEGRALALTRALELGEPSDSYNLCFSAGAALIELFGANPAAGSERVAAALTRLLGHEDFRVRFNAVRVLEGLLKHNPDPHLAREERALRLIRLLKDSNLNVALVAVTALSRFFQTNQDAATERVLHALADLLEDPDSPVSSKASNVLTGLFQGKADVLARALGILALRDKIARPDLLEPLALREPALFTPPIVRKLSGLVAGNPVLKYSLYYLRRGAGGPLPETLSSFFPHQQEARVIFGEGRKRLLVVHNISDGLGDELIRTAALLQAFLDFNPELEIVLLTHRPYLYDHPRLAVLPLGDDAVPEDKSFDGVIDFYDPGPNYSDAVERRVRRQIAIHPPRLFVSASKAHDSFTYETARLDDDRIVIPWTEENVYVSVYRLLAELGLPFKAGMEPRGISVLAGKPYPEAERWWRENVLSRNRTGGPVVLVNGFGGEGESKGFGHEQNIAFSAMIRSLIKGGSFVVLTLNDQPWGNKARAVKVLQLLTPAEVGRIAVSPEPGEDPRLPKHLVSMADRIITVEGGLMHVAYALGKPFEVLRMPSSGRLSKWMSIGLDQQQSAALPMGDAFLREEERRGRMSASRKDLELKGERAARVTYNPEFVRLLPEAVREKIEKILTTSFGKLNAGEDYSGTSGGRGILIELPKPIEFGGVTVTALKIKGASFDVGNLNEKFDLREVYRDLDLIGTPRPGEPLVHPDFDAEGRVLLQPDVLCPKGAFEFDRAKNEYEIALEASEKLSSDGLRAPVAVAYGSFPDQAPAGTSEVGFVVLGIPDRTDERGDAQFLKVAKQAGEIARFGDTGEANDARDMLRDFAARHGRALRDFHKMGYVHYQPHYGNFSFLEGQTFVYDLDLARRQSDMTVEQAFAYKLFDVYEAMWAFLNTQRLAFYQRVLPFNFIDAFLSGYLGRDLFPGAVTVGDWEALRVFLLTHPRNKPANPPLIETNLKLVRLLKEASAGAHSEKVEPPEAVPVEPAPAVPVDLSEPGDPGRGA